MDQVIKDFRNLDKRQEKIAREKVKAEVTSNRSNYRRQVGSSGGVAFLKREKSTRTLNIKL
jgi:hypothetical protein